MKRILLSLLLLFAASANAAIVNVVATGTFASVSGDTALLPFAEPAPGTQFVMTFSYDDQAFDFANSDPDVGLFLNSISAMSLAIGTDVFNAVQPGTILIVNDGTQAGNPDAADLWSADADVLLGAGSYEHDIALSLLNAQPLAEIPLAPLDSGELLAPFVDPAWDVAALRYRVKENIEVEPGVFELQIVAQAEAGIDSITVSTVPLPSAAWLFGTGLLGAAGLRRRP